MFQLVNMYQPVFRRQPKILSTPTLMTIIAIVMLFMAALYFNAHSTMQRLQRTSADLALNYTQLDGRLRTLDSVADLSTGVSISEEISTVQAQIDNRNALLNRMDNLFKESNTGFGEIFETLAQINLPGLWLTGIQLDQDGSIEISGSTLDPKLVPRYLQLITQQPSLETLNSGTVNLSREDSALSKINFVLSHSAYGEEQ